jgi:hypothetical protein
MRKNKQTENQKKAALKRAKKRNDRLRKTQRQKHIVKLLAIEEKKRVQKKEETEIEKILKSRNPDFNGFSSNNFPKTFAQYVHLAFLKKNMKLKKKKEQPAE